MRPIYRVALTLALVGPLSGQALAVEPDAPGALITPSEAVGIAVQTRLSAKFTAATNARKSEQGALVEYYSVPEQHLLWVDDKGITERGKGGDG
jgi:L,D-transpeptidase YcbB